MERYSEYKDSGILWLGKIPSHWKLRKMKFTFSERSQKGYPKEPLLAATQNHGVILKSQYENRTVEATKSLDTLKLVEVGDFVISLRSFQGGLEYAYNRGIISPAYTVLKPTYIEACYFKYLSKSDLFISLLKSTVTGIREGQNIDYTKLKENLLPLPPVSEQLAMGSYLDAATSKIDKAIAMQQKMIDLLNERKQIIIQNAVTKGLDKNVEMKDSGVEWIGCIPKHWEVGPFKRLLSIKNGADYKKYEVVNGGYPVIGSGGAFAQSSKFVYDGEVVLLGRKGTVDKPLYYKGKFWTVDTMFYGIPKNNAVCKYLYYQALTIPFKMYATSTAIPSMTQTDLYNNPMCVPPKCEQEKIANMLDEKMQNFDSAITNCQRQITLLQERKQIIVNEVVTGKVKVS